jgi:single-strand DNA-binding protein
MNKVFVIGRLTRDPEIRTTSTGKKVASFSIAVNEGKDPNGQERVQFFDLSAWDKLAEIIELYVKKGTKVAVIGSLQNRQWDKPDGTKGRATEITCKELEILSSKSESMGDSPTPAVPAPGRSASRESNKLAGDTEDDLPSKNDLPEINVDEINVQMPF